MSSNAIELSTKLWKECHLAVSQTSDRVRWLSKLVGLLITCLLVEATLAQNEPQGDLPFAVPDGFRVSRVADDALAHDCFCMTLDGQGRPVISGPGYLRTLVDQDNDGVFDRAIEWTKSIKAGAQGLWFEKSTLYYVSDGGLWKSQDNNSDAIADGNPTRVLEIPTGGEHDSHAIRRGPDGYWYLMVGNYAGAISKINSDPQAPVSSGSGQRPRAGTLWRISPDFSKRGVWAHGLRNCYDFDFLPDGQPVTYDSDDEREASLPWYRPTRVLALGPGSDGGWCGAAWKDDDYRVTMPTTLARLGRGSPTGVAVYDHHVFPTKYHGAVFVLDWTFGRVLAVYPTGNLPVEQQTPNKIPSEIFMQPSGSIGFAPTDICIAPDGSLLVSVGGRGTTGAIYRVATIGNAEPPQVASPFSSLPDAQSLAGILDAPCPWESWSENRWKPLVTPESLEAMSRLITGELKPDPAAGNLSPSKVAQYKQRAAQVLTRLGIRLTSDRIVQAAKSDSSASRSAAWWLIGRGLLTPADEQKLIRDLGGLPAVSAIDPVEEATPWETVFGNAQLRHRLEAIGLRRWPMGSWSRFAVPDDLSGNTLRRSWLWALNRSNQPPSVKDLGNKVDVLEAKLFFGAPKNGLDIGALESLGAWLSANRTSMTPRDQMECLHAMQAALGDRRGTLPSQSDVPADALDGVRAVYTSRMTEPVRNSWADWALYFAQQAQKSGQVALQAEAIRTIGMFESSDPKFTEYLFEQIDPTSHPTSDIHVLCALAQSTSKRTEEQTLKTASTLSQIVRKIKARGLYSDNQWPTRLKQLIGALSKKDGALGTAYAALSEPLIGDDLVVVAAFSEDVQNLIKQRVRRDLANLPLESWDVPVIKFAVSGSIDPILRTTLRKACEVESLRPVCLELLAKEPDEAEYELYVNALESGDRSSWSSAWKALEKITQMQAAREYPLLAKLVSASLNSNGSLPRSSVLQRARLAAKELSKPEPPASESWKDWETYYSKELAESQQADWVLPSVQVNLEALAGELKGLAGDPQRGKVLYQAKCAQCHGGQTALGPALTGVAKRFSTLDLLRSIYEPSRDVSDRYRVMHVLTVDDEILSGLVIYQASDGVTLQAADGKIFRINADLIKQKGNSTESLMPKGLLEGKTSQDVADLITYMQSL
jgi:putative heme-binding domain-containing protein